MAEHNAIVAERIRARVDEQLPLIAAPLRNWVLAHLTTPRQITASLDPEGSQLVGVWLVTDHTGAEDSSSRLVYELEADAFGIVIDMQGGVAWFQGPDDSLADAVNNM
jgi:hypothetical protein